MDVLLWWCKQNESVCYQPETSSASPLASWLVERAGCPVNPRAVPPVENTVVVFCCSGCSFYSFVSCLVCLFSFATFSTFSCRYYRNRSPVHVCRVRATLHHSRTNPPSQSSVCRRQPGTRDHRERSEPTVINSHVIMSILILSLTLHLPKHTACVAGELLRRMLSPQHHHPSTSLIYHTASG